jgi:hypothetical protein
MQEFQIKKFDIDNMCKTPSIIIISSRKMGKTTLCKKIMEKLKCKQNIVITHPSNDFVENDTTKVYTEYDENILKSLLDSQSNKYGMYKKIEDSKCFVVDDNSILPNIDFQKDKYFSELICNSRHYKIPFIFTCQIPFRISFVIQTNIDYIMLFSSDSKTIIKKIYDYFGGMFETFDDFYKIFNDLTKNYGVMVIKNCNVSTDNLSDRIFWYNAME